MKHVLQYLKGTGEKGLTFRRNNAENLSIEAYSDADWTDDTSEHHSTTGYCVSLSKNSALVSWKTGKQHTVPRAKQYMALASTIQECLYLEQLQVNTDS